MTNAPLSLSLSLGLLLGFLLTCTVACRIDEPIGAPGECVGSSWQTEIEVGADAWSERGASAADDGNHVVVIWEQQVRDFSTPMVPMVALLNRESGALLDGPHELLPQPPSELWEVSLVDLAGGGFLAFSSVGGFGVLVHHVGVVDGDTLEISSRAELSDVSGADGTVLVDADGVTIVGGFALARLDTAGRVVSTAGMFEGVDHCNSAVATSDGRMLVWCIATDGAGQWDHVVVVDAALDGSDARNVPLEASMFPPVHGLLTRLGDAIVVAFQQDAALTVAALHFDGAVRLAPVEIARADGDDLLLGSQVCTGTCHGLSLTTNAVSSTALVGFEVLVDSDSPIQLAHDYEVRFAQLALAASSEDATIETFEVSRPSRKNPAHAHAASPTRDGPVVTWLETYGLEVPWARAPQRVVVEKRCDLVPSE